MDRQGIHPGIEHRISLKSAAVALILVMHGLGVYLLLLPPRQLKQYTEVAFMTLIPPRPVARKPPMPLPMPMPATTVRQRPPAVAAAPPVAPDETITLAPAAPPGEVAEDTAPAAPAGDLRTRARLAAGSIDQALRAEQKKDKPWLAAPELHSDSKFSAMVASAWRGGPALRVEDYVTADGRAATRVVTATGTTCFAMQANPLGGADPFGTAGKVKRVPCP